MAQHDYDIANQSGANFRADLNNALDAIVSNNSGSSEPSTTFAYEWWIDTSNNLLKLRNSANNAWITLPLSITADNATSGALTVNGNLTTTGTVDINGQELILDADADTSITADTDDQIDFKIGNVDVATLTNSNLVLKGTTPTLTIGDAGAEDTKIVFDGNAQDFYIGLDDSADDLVIGTGSTVGTNGLVVIENGGNVGINTLTPTFRLDVNGSLSSNGNENVMRIAGSDTNNAGGITINNVFGASASARVSTLFSIDGQDQASPLAFGNGTSEAMRITTTGVGIGTTAPARLFHVNASSGGTNFTFQTGGANGYIELINTGGTNFFGTAGTTFEFYAGSGGAKASIDSSGNMILAGTLTQSGTPSDMRLKENIATIPNALKKVTQLEGLTWNYKKDGKRNTGLSANKLQEILPEAVFETHDISDVNDRFLAINYGNTVGLLVEAIKELKEELDEVKHGN